MINKKDEKKEPLKNANKQMPAENLKKKSDEKKEASSKKDEQSKKHSGCC